MRTTRPLLRLPSPSPIDPLDAVIASVRRADYHVGRARDLDDAYTRRGLFDVELERVVVAAAREIVRRRRGAVA